MHLGIDLDLLRGLVKEQVVAKLSNRMRELELVVLLLWIRPALLIRDFLAFPCVICGTDQFMGCELLEDGTVVS